MIPTSPVRQLALPALPAVPPRPGFPLVATLAPMVVSVAIWAITGSVYSLLFAALGPVVAVGGLLDGRRQRRRAARRNLAASLAALARLGERIDETQRLERLRRRRLAPAPVEAAEASRLVDCWSGPIQAADPIPLLLGRAEVAPVVALSDEDEDPDAAPAIRAAVAGLRRAASVFADAPVLADARDGVGVLGPSVAARAVARSLVLQLAARCSPASTTIVAPDGEDWAMALPHLVVSGGSRVYRVRPIGEQDLVVAWAGDETELAPGARQRVRLAPEPVAGENPAAPSPPIALSRARAAELAAALAEVARERGLDAATRALPTEVHLAELLELPLGQHDRGGLRAPIGRGAEGPVELDLVREGPHALVAGTTGAGKSEFLLSWVLAMASRHPPARVTFLLVDFKGGAAFAPLAGLPHVIGIVSDLDARRSRRAIESLRAELGRRERLFAERAARSIDELDGELARLVIVVDEFAAVVSGQPELHDVFADLAARGRSLGLHLVLCTQRPAGVVRDGVLANVALRISLRVTDRGDSLAMLGSDVAFALPPDPRGRAVIADGSGTVREVQLAIAEQADAERLRSRAVTGPDSGTGEPLAPVAWWEPLPAVLLLEELVRDADVSSLPGIPFGRLDLPAQQRQPVAVYDPVRDGHLLILGAARAGRSTAMATFAAGAPCLVLPSDPADAWTVLEELVAALTNAAPVRQSILLIDDLDLLIERFDPDSRQEFVDRLGRLARESRRLGLIVSAQRLTSPLQRLAGLFGARLLLRQPSRDEHVLAGGDGAGYDPRLPPGAGTWSTGQIRAATVQVAVGPVVAGRNPLSEPPRPELPRIRPKAGRPLALVAARPREVLRRMSEDDRLRVIQLGEEQTPDLGELRVSGGWAIPSAIVLLGDPDAWQAEWSLLTAVRRELPIAFHGCTAAELRALVRVHDAPPPLGRRAGECWLFDGGTVRRAILDWEAPDGDPGRGAPEAVSGQW